MLADVPSGCHFSNFSSLTIKKMFDNLGYLVKTATSGSPHYTTDPSSVLIHVDPYIVTTLSMSTVLF
jgi:hypothetical protein